MAETATPSTTPPQRGRRMPGSELGPKAATPFKAHPLSKIAGTGIKPAPLRANPPTGATDVGGTSPKRVSAAAHWQGNKARVVTLFHSNQHAALSFRTRARNNVAYVGRRRNGFAGDLKNYVASRESVVSRDTS